jgi:predicted nucleotidyltransferase
MTLPVSFPDTPIGRHRARLRADTIARLAARLAARPPAHGTERVVLFGSLARGDFDVASDVDLLVVGGDGVLDGRLDQAAGRPCDIVLWTTGQWRAALERGHPMALEIARDGVELWPNAPSAPAQSLLRAG